MDRTIEACTSTEVPAILRLLSSAGLPAAALGSHSDTALFAAREDGRLVGCAALEIYDGVGLLRSVAVEAEARGTGLGRRLTAAALKLARERGLTAVYLLTETAAAFFSKQGFSEVDRASAPAALSSSEEFAVACPEVATCMVFRLTNRC